MKKRCSHLFAVGMLILFAVAGAMVHGCAAPGGKPGQGGGPTTQQVVDEVQLDVPLIVGAAILHADNPQATAAKITDISQQILNAANTSTVNLRPIVDSIIARQASGKDRILAQILTDAIFARVQKQLGIDPALPIPAGQIDAVRAIVKAGAQAAIDAATRYGA